MNLFNNKNFSIIIPSWNNLPYLRLCIDSIRNNSEHKHQIIVHVNDGSDGTLEYVESEKIEYTHSIDNVGVCKAMNLAYTKCSNDAITYFNDDMVALPNWDSEIIDFYNKNLSSYDIDVWLSSTMIEPRFNNPCCLSPYNYGTTIEEFDYVKIIQDLDMLRNISVDVVGTTWPPSLMHRVMWDKIGGFSEEYFPGFGSDPDLAKKMYDIGVRNFIGVGKSLVYHFQCKTTGKIASADGGREVFKNKHKIGIEYFTQNILRRGSKFEDNKFIDLIKSGTPFAFSRFNDGEILAMANDSGFTARGDQEITESLKNNLIRCAQHEQENYWKGTPCSKCFPQHRKIADQIIGDSEYTCPATILINNWKYFLREFPAAIGGKKVIFISGNDQDPSKLWFLPIITKTHVTVPNKNSWNFYQDIKNNIELARELSNSIVLLSCGPLSRVLCCDWFQDYPESTFIDIGSCFDPFTRNVWHRCHTGNLPYCPECNRCEDSNA